MAGAGYKIFVDGDVLTATQVNTYLMEQAVMAFADATARNAAITSPSEGMTTYLKDTNEITVYDGSAWVAVADLDNLTFASNKATFAGQVEIANTSADLVLNDTDATFGGTIRALVDLEANGTRAGYVGFPASGRLYVRTENGDMYVQADNGSIYLIPEGSSAIVGFDADKARFYQDGTAALPLITWHSDQDTGIYRSGTNVLGIAAAGTECATFWSGTTATASPSTATTSGHQYVLRDNTFGLLKRYTSKAAVKENIETLGDTGAIIDSLRPVSFTPKFIPLYEGHTEDDTYRALREADVQYGFIAEEIAQVDDGRLAQWEPEGDLVVPAGWRWETMIAVLTKEVQDLRRRVADLEAGS